MAMGLRTTLKELTHMLALLLSTMLSYASDASLCVSMANTIATQDGYHTVFVDEDTLKQGQMKYYTFDLQAGRSYLVVACGDEKVKDLDLRVYDTQLNIIALDNRDEKYAMVYVTPVWGATFRIDTILYDSDLQRASFQIVILAKQVAP